MAFNNMSEQQVIDRATSMMKRRSGSHGLFVKIIAALARLNYKDKISDKALEDGNSGVTAVHTYNCENYFKPQTKK